MGLKLTLNTKQPDLRVLQFQLNASKTLKNPTARYKKLLSRNRKCDFIYNWISPPVSQMTFNFLQRVLFFRLVASHKPIINTLMELFIKKDHRMELLLFCLYAATEKQYSEVPAFIFFGGGQLFYGY